MRLRRTKYIMFVSAKSYPLVRQQSYGIDASYFFGLLPQAFDPILFVPNQYQYEISPFRNDLLTIKSEATLPSEVL